MLRTGQSLVFILTISSGLFAGDMSLRFEKFIYPQSIAIEANNSLGFSNMITTSVAEISSSNPASLANFSTFSFGFNFEYATQIDLISDITLANSKHWLPASFGAVYPYHNFDFAIAYYRKYHAYLDYGDITITTVQNPDGTGEIYHGFDETIVHSLAAIFAYSVDHLFSSQDHLAIGAQLFWDFWSSELAGYLANITINANKSGWKIGMLYKFKEPLGFGIFYEEGVDLTGEVKTSNKFVDDSGSLIRLPEYPETLKLPGKLSIGLTAQSIKNLYLAMTFSTIFWSSVHDDYQDHLDISMNSEYSLSDRFAFSLGFYATDRIYKSSYYSSMNENANFIVAGVRYKLAGFDWRLVLFDSHFFTSEYRKQTILRLGFDYGLKK